MTGTFKSLSPEVKDGEFVWYHQNEKKQTVTFYQDNATINTKSWDEEGVEIINVRQNSLEVCRHFTNISGQTSGILKASLQSRLVKYI